VQRTSNRGLGRCGCEIRPAAMAAPGSATVGQLPDKPSKISSASRRRRFDARSLPKRSLHKRKNRAPIQNALRCEILLSCARGSARCDVPFAFAGVDRQLRVLAVLAKQRGRSSKPRHERQNAQEQPPLQATSKPQQSNLPRPSASAVKIPDARGAVPKRSAPRRQVRCKDER